MSQHNEPTREEKRQAAIARRRMAMSVKDRRAAKKESGLSMKDFKSGAMTVERQAAYDVKRQDVDNVSDYDFNAHKSGAVNTGELVAMRDQGFSRKEIREAAAASGLEIAKRAQARFDRWDEKAAAKGNKGGGNNGGGNTEIDSTTTNETTQVNDQNISQSSENVGDNNVVNQNQDNSNTNKGGDSTSEINAKKKAKGLKNLYVDSLVENATNQTNRQNIDQTSKNVGNGNVVTQNQQNNNTNKGGNSSNYMFGLY